MAVDFSKELQSSRALIRMELTPLIDVIFQLLIFFMISSTFLYPSLDIALPQVEEAQDMDSLQELVLSVGTDGTCYINNEAMPKSMLQERITLELERQRQKSLFFRADSQISYQEIMDLMQVANKAGATQFNFLHEHAEASAF